MKKRAQKEVSNSWNLSQIWNTTLDNPVQRVQMPRDYMYASELGKAFCDRYLKMYGVKPTNPPNTRSLRKFQAGDSWEFIVGMVLTAAGMLKKQQVRVEAKFPKLLRVSGRLDYVVGSPDNYDTARETILKTQESMEAMGWSVPPFFFKAMDNFLQKHKGKKLLDVIAEIKSVSSFMMEKIQKTGAPMYHHAFQNFHYVYGNDMGLTEGKLLYICKDDCIMEEFPIHNNEEMLALYKADIKAMTKYYNAGFDPKDPTRLMPPREPLVLFEEGVWKFSKNWNVEYSDYLTFLYTYATPEAYRMAWQYKVSSWNRVFRRLVLEENITDKNRVIIDDMKKYFPKIDKYVVAAKKSKCFIKQDDVNDEPE